MEDTFLNELNQKQNEALNDVNEALEGISYEEQSLNLDSVNYTFDISQQHSKQSEQQQQQVHISSDSFKSLSFNESLSKSPPKRQQDRPQILTEFEPDSTLNMEKYLQKVNENLQNELAQVDNHMKNVSSIRSGPQKGRDSIDEEFEKLFNRPVLLPEVSVVEVETPQKQRKIIPLPDITEDTSHLFQKVSPPKRTSSQLSSPQSLGPYVDVELENSLFGTGHKKLPEVEQCEFDRSHGNIKLPEPEGDEFKILKERVEHLEHDKSQLRQKVEQLSSRNQSPVHVQRPQIVPEHETINEQENSFSMERINKQNDVVTLKSKVSLLERRLEHSEFTAKKYQDERDIALQDAELLKREVQRLQLQVTDLRRQVSNNVNPEIKEKFKNDVKQKLLSHSVGVSTQRKVVVSSPSKQSHLRATVSAKPQVTRKKQMYSCVGGSTQKTWAKLKSHDPKTCDLCSSGNLMQSRHYDHALDVTKEDIDDLVKLLEDERYALNHKYETVLNQYKDKRFQNEDSIITEMNSLLETMTTKAEELQMLKNTQKAHGLQRSNPKSNLMAVKEQHRLQKLKQPHVCNGNCK